MFASLSRRPQFAQSSHLLNPAILALAAGLVASLVPAAHAQTRVWSQATDNWSNALQWSDGNVPDNAGENAELNGVAAYILTMNTNYSIGGITISNPAAALQTVPSTTLGISANSTNNGVITLNSTGVNSSTILSVNNSFTMSGSGSLVLNANTASLDSAYLYFNNGANVLTNGASHTIRGTGNIYTNINNLGTIQADVNGRVLNLHSQPKTNSGTFRANNGATLAISGINVTQTGGQIVADAGTVSVVNSGITGGTISGINTGTFSFNGSSAINGVTLVGPASIAINSTLALTGTSNTNNSVLTVNPAGTNNSTILSLNSITHTINGTGSIVLNSNTASLDSAYLYFNNGANVLTNGASHTIRGTGNVYTNIINQGTIQADVSGRILNLNSQPKTNNNLIRATSGATLQLSGIGLTQSPTATLRADGGAVQIINSSVNGGILQTINAGTMTVQGSSLITGVNNTASLDVGTNSTMRLDAAGFTNNAVVTVNPTGANATTILSVDAPAATINGTGTIALNANSASLDSAYLYFNNGANVLTLGSGQTLRGTGNVYTNIINNGLINADVSGRPLRLNSQPKTNNTIMKATNGGTLHIDGVAISQPATATLLADGGTVQLTNASVTGGLLTAINGGAFNITGSAIISASTITHDINVLPAAVLRLTSDGLVNNGRIVVNPTAANSATIVSLDAPAATITGTGTILLNADPANTDSAYLYFNNGANVLTLGPGQTLAGRGRCYPRLTMQGTFAPGSPTDSTGTLHFNSPVIMEPSGVLDIQIGGTATTDFDRLVSSQPFAATGLVRVTLVDGFTNPAVGTFFDVITAPAVTGECLNSDMPRGWGVFFVPGALRIQYTGCLADLDCGNGSGTPDGGVDINDLLFFLSAFEAGTTNADLDDGSGSGTQDGGVDINDLLYFLNRFEGGC